MIIIARNLFKRQWFGHILKRKNQQFSPSIIIFGAFFSAQKQKTSEHFHFQRRNLKIHVHRTRKKTKSGYSGRGLGTLGQIPV